MDTPEQNPFAMPQKPVAMASSSSSTSTSSNGNGKLPSKAASKRSVPAPSAPPPTPQNEEDNVAVPLGGTVDDENVFRNAEPTVQRPRSLLASCVQCCQGCTMLAASQRWRTLTLLVTAAILNFSLFVLSLWVMNQPTDPFPKHNVNWRIPLCFFVTLMACSSIGHIMLDQRRALLAMTLGILISACLYFYCMIIDGISADKAYTTCKAAVGSSSSGQYYCEQVHGPHAGIVLIDFANIPWLTYVAIVVWYHRKLGLPGYVKKVPVSSAPGAGADKGDAQGPPDFNSNFAPA